MSQSPVDTWVGISWNDNSVVLQCDRPECMVDNRWHYTEDVPYLASPEAVVEQANRHRATHQVAPS